MGRRGRYSRPPHEFDPVRRGAVNTVDEALLDRCEGVGPWHVWERCTLALAFAFTFRARVVGRTSLPTTLVAALARLRIVVRRARTSRTLALVVALALLVVPLVVNDGIAVTFLHSQRELVLLVAVLFDHGHQVLVDHVFGGIVRRETSS